MDTPQVKKVELLEEASLAFPMLAAVSDKKHAADEAVIEATLQATNDTQSSGRMKRRMVAAVSSREGTSVGSAPAPKPRLGAAPPLPIPNPPLPPLPPSGGPDGSLQGWDGSQWEDTNFSNTGVLNGLYNILQTIKSHPTESSFYSLIFYINGLAEHGLITGNVAQMLSSAPTADLIDGAIERTALFAFYSGYTDASGTAHAAGMDSYQAFLNDWKNTETQINNAYPNPYTQEMVNELGKLLTPASIADFKSKRVADNGDLILQFGGSTFDWTAAQASGDTATQKTILWMISNQGITGDPNIAIDELDASFGQIQSLDLLATMDAVWKKYHDVGLMILAFMQGSDTTYLNDESGNADIMNQQDNVSKNYVQEIQSIISEIGTWPGQTTPAPIPDPTPDQLTAITKLMSAIPEVIAMINASGQFSELQGPIANFVANLKSTSGTLYYDLPKTDTVQVSMYDVLVNHSYTDSSGTVHQITPQEAIQVLHDALTPSPSSTAPSGGPSANPVPNTEGLQGFISTVTAISSAVSSSSTQLTTATSQIEQMHQALLKLGTGVIDPKNGLMAITNNAVSHQVSN